MIGRVRDTYPNASYFANTLREVISANLHMWGGLVFADGAFHVAEPREIGVIDRIGGGDGFVGGMLYGILRGWEPEKFLQFGWATGALAATFSPTTRCRPTRRRSGASGRASRASNADPTHVAVCSVSHCRIPRAR
jgi:hypothetical protein